MSRIKVEITPEMSDRELGVEEVAELIAGQIERRLRAAIMASHGRRGLAMLDDALDVIEEAMEAPPLGYRRQGPEVLQIPGEVL